MREQPNGKLNRAQVNLVKPVEHAKERALHLDEMDEADAPGDSEFERLFDDPTDDGQPSEAEEWHDFDPDC